MFSFVTPLFAAWCAAAIIPLILHLMQSSRTVVLPFSTLRFLKQARKQSSRRVKMEYFLLWLLRTLLLIVLALAFAIPVLRTADFGNFLGRSARDVALVLDNSYSEGYRYNGTPAWNDVIDTACALVNGLSDKDRFCIYLAADHVTPVYEQLNSGKEEAITRLKALKMGFTSSQLAPAIIDANKALEQDARRNEREIHVITDMQAVPWAGFKAPAKEKKDTKDAKDGKDKEKKDKKEPEKKDAGKGETEKKKEVATAAGGADKKEAVSTGKVSSAESIWDPSKINDKTTVFVTLVGAPAPENVSPIDISIEPPLIMADVPPQVTVHVARTGPQVESTLTAFVDDKEVARRSVILGEGSTVQSLFSLPPLTPGVHQAWIETPDDGLPVDNKFYFLIRCKAKLPTLCVGTKDDAGFLKVALSASIGGSSTIDFKHIQPAQLSEETLQSYVCIFLCNVIPLAGQELIRLEQYVRAGGLVVLFPGDGASAADYAAWSGLPGQPTAVKDIPLTDRKRMLRWNKPRHMIFSSFKLDAPAPVLAVRRNLAFDKPAEGADVLISTGAGIPFLLSRQLGRGEFFMFTVSANRAWSDFPLSPFFLPLMHQIVQYSAGVGSFTPYLWSTESLPLQEYLPEANRDTVLKDPDGNNVSIRSAVSEGRTVLHAEGLMAPGIYTMSGGAAAPAGAQPALAINMERLESNLTPVVPNDIPEIMGLKNVQVMKGKEDLLHRLKDFRVGKTLGESLLWLALLLAALEYIYSGYLSRKGSKLTDTLLVKESGKLVEESSREAASEAKAD